jgi:hypothetical protein
LFVKTATVLRQLGVASPRRKQPEFEHQCALFTWARMPVVRARYPELALLCASLNGVPLDKVSAGKAFASGMRAGEHDISLRVLRWPYTGLSIEMKAGKNVPTCEQLEYGALIAAQGWCVKYCWSWEEAKAELEAYLALPKWHPKGLPT